ncbi:MAG: hypothetical protein J5612_01605 [Paludibacteraceae bacterium]|nr:hypothetical protein [Paludibacteraceae bacterium]
MKKSTTIILISVLAVALAAVLFLFLRQRSEVQEMVEQMEFEKEQLQEEYEDLAIQFDGYQTLDLRNDSLQQQLAREQQRVQDLLEELRVTRATNAKRIAELKKELATVRAVMVEYVHQIDSLNQTNAKLTQENRHLTQQYHEVSTQAQQLQEEKTQLTEVVKRASMLEIIRFEMTPLNKRDRKTRVLSQMVKFQFDYTLGKNITCEPGNKIIYLRVVNPKGEVLNEDKGYTFFFESADISCSAFHQFEYAGEQIDGTMFVSLTNEPVQGFYNADFFVDGNMIGSFPFQIRK